jgi:hypothetical protein
MPHSDDFGIRVFGEFFRKADVGFAVFDRKLRYKAINQCLANIHGLPISSHIGKTIQDVLGEFSGRVTPAIQAVFKSGAPVHQEIVGSLPGQSRLGRWSANYFDFTNSERPSRLVAVVVVELAADVRLQDSVVDSRHVLRSWKEIAQYLGSCVKTVQRWEHLYKLPVRRLHASKGATVFAIKSELEHWQAEATDMRPRTSRAKY